MDTNLADRLLNAIDEKKNPSVVGLDPRIANIPEHIRKRAARVYGGGTRAVADAIVDFTSLIIEQIADVVPAVKPQKAFYEQYGPDGVWAFQRTVEIARNHGLVVIGDVKRNDIGSTAEAYAQGLLGCPDNLLGTGDVRRMGPVFDLDAVTVNAYLGSDGVKPFLKVCGELGKGIFVLVKTSNKSSSELQDKTVEGEGKVYRVMAELIKGWGQEFVGKRGYSSIGAVVGATFPEQAEELRAAMPQTLFLVPGYGAQGGGAGDVVPCFNEDGYGAIVNSSRGIIFAYQKEQYKDQFKPTDFH